MRTSATCVFAMLCISVSAHAQLGLRATTSGSGVFEDDAVALVAPGIDVSAGFTLPEADFTVARAADQIEARVATNISITAAGSESIEATIDIDLTSQAPVEGLEVTLANEAFVIGGDGILCSAFSTFRIERLGGDGDAVSLPFGSTTVRDVAVGPGNPARFRMFVRSSVSWLSFSNCGTLQTICECSLTVRRQTQAAPFGVPCGVDLTANALLDAPNAYDLRLAEPTPLPFGVLLVGTDITAIPLPWSCTLYTNLLGSIPLVPDATGTTQVRIEFPAGIWTLQAGTFGGTTIRMSQGIGVVAL